MQIINLVENELGSSGCEAAHGLSFYVETKNHKLLFDTSPSEVVLRNAQKLGVDLTVIDTVILSHGHYDHSGGILAFVEIDKKILSLPQVQLLKGDTKIDDELQVFTVDNRAFPLPSTNKRLRELCNGQYIQDDFKHEQNLLLTCEGKKILFCGCAHNGILNVMETLERKLGSDSLPDLVIGGFHLMKRTEFSQTDTAEVTEIANRLRSYKAHFATCHCTGLPVFNFGCTPCDGESFSYIEISVLIGLLIASLLDTLDKKMIQKVLSKKDVIDFILENGSNSELLSWIEKQINDR